MDFIEQFRAAMAQHGIICESAIIANGDLHRFHVNGDNNRSTNGWYVLHIGEFAAGAYGCWKRDISKSWSSKSFQHMTPYEQTEYRKKISDAKAAAEAKRVEAQSIAKQKAFVIWKNAKPADKDHPYLVKKDINPGTLRIDENNNLIVPLYGVDGQLYSLQFIYPNGEKRFLTDGAKKGNYFPIGKNKDGADTLFFAEGIATAISIHLASGCAVACAFDSQNLLSVGQALRKKFPDIDIMFAADNDQWPDEAGVVINTGINKAKKAAALINGSIVFPDFTGLDISNKPTDFNDLMLLAGLDEVKKQLTVTPPSSTDPNDSYTELAISQRPKIAGEAFFGIIKDFIETSKFNSEASDVGVAANVIAHFCARINRKAYISIGDADKHCRPFFLLVGSSGKARKGGAEYLAKRVFEAVEKIFEKNNPYHERLRIHTGGLSSGEGVGFAIRDASDDPKNIDQGIIDKRLLVIESEFANVFAQCKRDKSILSPTIRNLFDGNSLEPLTKTNRIKVTDPHVVILGNITQLELNSMSGVLEATNGFLNRFLICFVERGRLIPIPEKTPDETIMGLAQKIVIILEFIDNQASQSNGRFEVGFTEDARKLWFKAYPTLSREQPGLIGALTARIEFYARMLSMIFCLLDQKTLVEVKHLTAALLWIDYTCESVRYIFSNAANQKHHDEIQQIADRIEELLHTTQSVSKTEINKAFGGHKSAAHIEEALQLLLTANPPIIRIEIQATGGKPKQIYHLANEEKAK